MAILKGVPRKRIILRHALLNAVGPIVNVIALNLAYLVSGVVIVETIFSYPGLAKLMIDAVQTRDLPLVQGACAMVFCATYIVLIFIAGHGVDPVEPEAPAPEVGKGERARWPKELDKTAAATQFEELPDAPPRRRLQLSWSGKLGIVRGRRSGP